MSMEVRGYLVTIIDKHSSFLLLVYEGHVEYYMFIYTVNSDFHLVCFFPCMLISLDQIKNLITL